MLLTCAQLPCPHCGQTGALVRHGHSYNYDYLGIKTIRLWRIFCDPDSPHKAGCGRTFSLQLASTLPGRSFSAALLELFIACLLAGFSIRKSWQEAAPCMSLRSGYRVFQRLLEIQPLIRTALFGRAPPALGEKKTPLLSTLKIQVEAFGSHAVEAYQDRFQRAYL
ncbi:MAG: hypothetical protein GY801_49895 [bacterium]|nr:hypothetical protein [bacterium]